MEPQSTTLGWVRGLRPLLWWTLLVVVLFGYRKHIEWLDKTRIKFTVSLQDRPVRYDAAVTLNGKRVSSGQQLELFQNVTLTVSHPKAESFSTNFFVWYGEHDFGNIDLRRSTGTLTVKCTPRATRITIRGPEFSTVLTNSSGENLLVPTDSYDIEALFAHSRETDTAHVAPQSIAKVNFSPSFGRASFTSSHSNTTFQLLSKNGSLQITGELPETISELPVGEYELITERRRERQVVEFRVVANETNAVSVEYKYGAILLESEPSGAMVLDENRQQIGKTPVHLTELHIRPHQFTLEHEDYHSVAATLDVRPDETNHFNATLVNRYYAAALRSARNYFENARYEDAAASAEEALKHKADDSSALSLKREATGMDHLTKAQSLATRGDLTNAIVAITSALEFIPENAEAKQLLNDYTKKQVELEEQDRKKREAEVAAIRRAEKIKDLRNSFNVLLRGFPDWEKFAEHELVTTNVLSRVANAIKDSLSTGESSFKIVRFEQPRSDVFAIQARQFVGFGYRDCFVVGEDVHEGEIPILFKVLEYDHLPEVKLLGGFVTASITQEANSGSAEVFAEQVRAGALFVKERLARALSKL